MNHAWHFWKSMLKTFGMECITLLPVYLVTGRPIPLVLVPFSEMNQFLTTKEAKESNCPIVGLLFPWRQQERVRIHPFIQRREHEMRKERITHDAIQWRDPQRKGWISDRRKMHVRAETSCHWNKIERNRRISNTRYPSMLVLVQTSRRMWEKKVEDAWKRSQWAASDCSRGAIGCTWTRSIVRGSFAVTLCTHAGVCPLTVRYGCPEELKGPSWKFGSIRTSACQNDPRQGRNMQADLMLVTCIPRVTAALHTAEPVYGSELRSLSCEERSIPMNPLPPITRMCCKVGFMYATEFVHCRYR